MGLTLVEADHEVVRYKSELVSLVPAQLTCHAYLHISHRQFPLFVSPELGVVCDVS